MATAKKTTKKTSTRKCGPKKCATKKASPKKKVTAKKTAAKKPAVKAKAKTTAKKTTSKKTAAKKVNAPTATDQVLKVIKRFKKGVSVPGIKERTGFEDKAIRNIVARAYKQGKIKRVDKGLYAGG
jgi:hypothetical protein